MIRKKGLIGFGGVSFACLKKLVGWGLGISGCLIKPC